MGQTNTSALDKMLEQYGGGATSATKGVTGALSKAAPGLMENILGSSQSGMPGYNEIFRNLRGSTEAELARQLGGLNEAMGSRGLRYSSDTMRQAATARVQGAQQIIGSALPFRQQAWGEVAQAGQLGLSAGQLQQQARERGMENMFVDWIRRTNAPAGLAGFANYALGMGTAGQGSTVYGT